MVSLFFCPLSLLSLVVFLSELSPIWSLIFNSSSSFFFPSRFWNLPHLIHASKRLTYRSKRILSARSARSTPSTRSPNTRRARSLLFAKVVDDMIASKAVMVDRPSLFSTRRRRQQRRSCSAWPATIASDETNRFWSDARPSNLVLRRRTRAELLSFKLCPNEDILFKNFYKLFLVLRDWIFISRAHSPFSAKKIDNLISSTKGSSCSFLLNDNESLRVRGAKFVITETLQQQSVFETQRLRRDQTLLLK
jgi:hypothetical protein